MRVSLAVAAALIAFAAAPAQAESCSRSRDYLLGGMAGDLLQPPQSYQALFKSCLTTISMSNVKDAYILNDGGIAVVPKQDTLSATAATLSAFCDAYPGGTLRFLSRNDIVQNPSVIGIVRMSSTGSTPCKKIKGNMD
jgi:hypothetical protein